MAFTQGKPGQADVPTSCTWVHLGVRLCCAAGSSTQPEEEAFFEVVAALMQGELGVAQAVLAFATVCQNRADQLRCARELSSGGTCGGA